MTSLGPARGQVSRRARTAQHCNGTHSPPIPACRRGLAAPERHHNRGRLQSVVKSTFSMGRVTVLVSPTFVSAPLTPSWMLSAGSARHPSEFVWEALAVHLTGATSGLRGLLLYHQHYSQCGATTNKTLTRAR